MEKLLYPSNKEELENLEAISTKNLSSIVNNLTSSNREQKILVITNNPSKNLKLGLRNLPNIQLSYSNSLNLRDVVLSKEILITENALKYFSLNAN